MELDRIVIEALIDNEGADYVLDMVANVLRGRAEDITGVPPSPHAAVMYEHNALVIEEAIESLRG